MQKYYNTVIQYCNFSTVDSETKDGGSCVCMKRESTSQWCDARDMKASNQNWETYSRVQCSKKQLQYEPFSQHAIFLYILYLFILKTSMGACQSVILK